MKKKKIQCFLFFYAFLLLTAANSQPISVINTDGSIRASLETKIFNSSRFISMHAFADVFNAPVYFDSTTFTYKFSLAKKAIIIIPFSPFIQIANHYYQLPVPSRWNGKNIYLPLTSFMQIINSEFSDAIFYDSQKATLQIIKPIFSKTPNIKDIDIEPKLNGTLIIVKTNKSFSEANISVRARHQWLYLDIYGGYADSLGLYAQFNRGKVARIVPNQVSDELAQIGFRFRDEIVEKDFYLETPRKILVTVKTKSDISEEINQVIEQEKKKWRIDRIVIDPGHGGIDPGAVGPSGTYEKDVVLAIAKYLRDYLVKQLGVEVLMTRETDKFVELKERTAFANRHEAKLFISIHANSNPQKWLRGVSTYFLGIDMSEEARQVAQFENSVIKYENKSHYSDMTAEQFILSAGAQAMYTKESEDLAGMIQETMIEQCKLRNLGVRQANFYVLWRASMPNVLIETAFISNRQEEKLLRTPAFQKKVAYSIFLSVKKFKEKYESMF